MTVAILLLLLSVTSALPAGCWLRNTTLICGDEAGLNQFPRLDKAHLATVQEIQISNQTGLVQLKREDLQNFTNLTRVSITNSRLEAIDWFTLHDPKVHKEHFRELVLYGNRLSTLDWRSVSFVRSLFELNVRENPLSCDCENQWLFEHSSLSVPRIFDGPYGKQKSYNTTAISVFKMPSSVRIDNQSCSWESCQMPSVHITEPRGVIIDAGGSAHFQCLLTGQTDTDYDYPFEPLQLLMKKNLSGVTRRLIEQEWMGNDSLKITFSVTNASHEDMGWLICQSWHSVYPAFDIGFLAVRSVPEIAVEVGDVSADRGLYKALIRITAYPLNCDCMLSHPATGFNFSFSLNEPKRRDSEYTLMVDQTLFYKAKITYLPKLRWDRPPRIGRHTIQACNSIGCTETDFIFKRSDGKVPPPLPNPQSSTGATEPPENSGEMKWALISAILLAICVTLSFAIILWLWHARSKPSSRQEPVTAEEEMPLQDMVYDLRMMDINQIKKEDLTIISELGQGAFGEVYLAYWTVRNEQPRQASAVSVAVKVLKDFAPHYRRDFQREASLMAKLSHENVVQFFGICTDGVDLLLVYEYMDIGDLKAYLRKRGPNARYLTPAEQSNEKLTLADLLRLACQATTGLTYLTQMRVVHRDLAARNCLLGGIGPALKLSDFGLSRDLYSNEYYRIHSKRVVLPVRWLPPESLILGKFTHESDIWSLGILLWEIFSHGQIPYPHLSNDEVLQAAKNGLSPAQPNNCPIELYRLMRRCWEQVPSQRIQVTVLQQHLQEMLQHSLSATDDLGYLTCEFQA